MPAGEPHAALPAEDAEFAQLVIANGSGEPGSEPVPKLGQTFACALTGRVVTDAHKSGVTRVIAVGDNVIGRIGTTQKRIQQMVVGERIPQPNESAMEPEREPERGIPDDIEFVTPPLSFRFAGIVNITDNDDSSRVRHTLVKLGGLPSG